MKFIMSKCITFVDWVSAILVLISIACVARHPEFWIVYSVACIAYATLNWYKKLYGQSIMNLVASLIAILNFIGH